MDGETADGEVVMRDAPQEETHGKVVIGRWIYAFNPRGQTMCELNIICHHIIAPHHVLHCILPS